jgi:hypothetical protein
MISRFPAPRQQFVEPIDGMSVDHPLQHVAQIRIGFDVIELAGRDQRADDRPALAAAVAAREQVVLAAECDRSDCAFDGIVSSSTRPSCRKRVSPCQRESA